MFQKLHGQGMANMYITFIIAALKAEKFQKPKCGLFVETPCRFILTYIPHIRNINCFVAFVKRSYRQNACLSHFPVSLFSLFYTWGLSIYAIFVEVKHGTVPIKFKLKVGDV